MPHVQQMLGVLSLRVQSALVGLYLRIILKHPRAVLAVLCAITALCVYFLPAFRLDASSDSLVLENDADLRYYERSRRVFESDDFLLITFTPDQGTVFQQANLDVLAQLVADIRALDGVVNVNSILDVPLFHSPDISLIQLATGFNTLSKPGTDRELAARELTSSPLYRELLVSEDGRTTAIQIQFADNDTLRALSRKRSDLRAKKYTQGLTPAEADQLAEVTQAHRKVHTADTERWRQKVAQVRGVISGYDDQGTLFLGGVPMIVNDMIAFVRADILTFGLGVGLFLMVILAIIFRRWRWVLLPLGTCVLAVLLVMGYLGMVDWRATVISSNFTALLLIITMSMAIHLVVRYRQIQADQPELSRFELVREATLQVARPCLYCALTTMVGFGSLVVSHIPPVTDFGLMMTLGIGVAYLLVFSLMPAVLMLLPVAKATGQLTEHTSWSSRFAVVTDRLPRLIPVLSVILAVGAVWGMTRLSVENRFIDYFKQNTEIYQGMEIIDRRLGGTTPLEVILESDQQDYWFTSEGLAKIRKVHQHLEALPETGKVLSLDTMMQVVEGVNDGKPINPMMLGLLRQFIPNDVAKEVVRPYANDDFTQVRIVARVKESYPGLDRNALLDGVREYLHENLAVPEANIHMTGMYVLYNNMLQSLFKSQILTIGMVFFATWLMFALLFQSAQLATIGLVPNVLPVLLVLGAMGWAGIPLDMMTITIAAITIGIAVDHTIHYIHRFKREFAQLGEYRATMYRCHKNIGQAMYYTSVTIILGFSIMSLSNFVPTVYFGLFTGLAMLVAMLAALTLLPRLLLLWQPLGLEHQEERTED